ncbi:hypothetical protein [Tropicibacter naphthalenivorans]|uniref:Uncharacterized protein n=1 Tax=Tropicibacter naphthalenivorans TaxID=441103 RepID=A0A0N7M156_9RHOB|nr:hypothetical protein [Tropicibacter naphthalenivorans]CUH82329.1 hypothetical protein TRN7648_03914 [Tropicibacter naphthalenivorans]SMD05632.1 hypothetical protein SAMN04488093_11328 [Tropicibacter naphthalenivorans]
MKRCLLIAPLSFYAFHKDLGAALERAGYAVEMLNEEYPASTLGKIMGKLALDRLRKTTLAELERRLPQMGQFDLVVIVKGRGLGPAALELLRRHATRIVGYNFDSFRFNPSPKDWLHLCDRYCTFDIADARDTGLPLVHLFSAATRAPEPSRDTDLSVVMKIHSDRLAYVDRVLAALPAGRKPFVFLYAPNWFEVLKQALRAPGPIWRLRRHISFTPMSYADAMTAIARSRATLDYAHPLQSGITVRCYEAQSLKVAVVTNNPYVAEAGVFTPGAVATFGLEDDPAQLGPILETLDDIDITPAQRDTDTFLADLLDEAGQQTRQRDTA